MSVSEDLETRLRSLSIDRGSVKAPAHGQPALSTVPKQPKATPPRRIWRRVGGLLLLGVAGVVALTFAFPDRAPSFAAPAITKATRLWDTASGVFASQERPADGSQVTTQPAAPAETTVLAETTPATPEVAKPIAATGPRVIGSGFVVAPTSVVLMSDIGGQVELVDVEVGARLKAGDPVLRLEQSDAELAVGLAHEAFRLAQARLRSARADHAAAAAPLQRLETLEARGVGRRAELEDARLNLAVLTNSIAIAQSQVETARLTLQRAERDLEKHTLRAPFDAVVVDLPAAPGMMVSSGTNGGADEAGLMELMDVSHLYVDVDVAERNIAEIQIDQLADVRLDAFPDRSFSAQVSVIDPRASREKATIRVRLRLDDEDLIGVRPNMSAKATFINLTDRALAQLRLNGSE